MAAFLTFDYIVVTREDTASNKISFL